MVYGPCLGSSDLLIHLAATTGKAPRGEYFNVNSSGTRYLLAQCKERDVKNFLYVSSIAVKFKDKSNYYYAQSKQEGEQAVRESGLNYTIVRPTIVLGKESPGWEALSKLARLSWVPILGNGTARVQPIDVDDLADTLVSLVEERRFFNETLEVGGPEAVSIEEFLIRIHRLYYGNEPKTVHLPYKPIAWMVAYVEKYLSSLMPLNAGQLSSFVEDGTVTTNPLYEKQRSRMKDLDSLIGILTRDELDKT
jgi:NADH dehydrogenase